jgi:hypothetical protein
MTGISGRDDEAMIDRKGFAPEGTGIHLVMESSKAS